MPARARELNKFSLQRLNLGWTISDSEDFRNNKRNENIFSEIVTSMFLRELEKTYKIGRAKYNTLKSICSSRHPFLCSQFIRLRSLFAPGTFLAESAKTCWSGDSRNYQPIWPRLVRLWDLCIFSMENESRHCGMERFDDEKCQITKLPTWSGFEIVGAPV